MATIELIHKRVGNDIGMALRILDSNVAIDWTTVDRVYASLFSDQQRVRLGQCKVLGPDSEDPTTLSLLYSAKNPQYLGITSLIVEVTYHGHVSTFDKPVLVFVASTAEEGTYPVTVEIAGSLDPEENNLEIEVTDVDTSVLDAAIQAANDAAEAADAAIAKLKGGTTGQILTKKTNAELDIEWKDPQGGGKWGEIIGDLEDQTDLKNALDGKQDVIEDLESIRSGAAAGATALQPADITTLEGKVEAIEGKIPAAASSQNQLADKNFVNSSISTATATFKGTYNLVSDLSLTTSATTAQVATALGTEVSGADNNDYAFVQIPTADATPTEIARIDRYKYNGTAWSYEFSLNNSSFTAVQWAAINSGITAELVTAFGAKYSKPSGGIPKTDMASGVQTSLEKADSAYQKPQNGIPAADIASGVIPTSVVQYSSQSLTDAQKAQARTNIGATAPEIFWAVQDVTTSAQIEAALTAGMLVVCKYQFDASVKEIVFLSAENNATYWKFYGNTNGMLLEVNCHKTTSVWSASRYGAQLVSNMVGSIPDNDTSTTKYPHCKAVVDYVSSVAAMLASGMSGIKIWVGTQADYNLLTPANDTLYFIKSS